MRKSGGGSVIYIASISGMIPQLHNTIQYGASKAALIFMAEPMALQLAHDNIRVNIVSPGVIFSKEAAGIIFKKPIQKNLLAIKRMVFQRDI